MGCYWNCDCTFKADSSSHQTIKDRMIAIWGDAQHCIFESGVDEFTVSYYDHSFYSLGQYFHSCMADIASEFELDGECIISTDEDEGNPPWKTTFEHGELVEWHGNVFYTKVNTKLFYWSVYPMHGLVWAESVEDAQNMVMDKLREKFPDEDEGSMDDVAIYPVNQPIDTEFQMFDH